MCVSMHLCICRHVCHECQFTVLKSKDVFSVLFFFFFWTLKCLACTSKSLSDMKTLCTNMFWICLPKGYSPISHVLYVFIDTYSACAWDCIHCRTLTHTATACHSVPLVCIYDYSKNLICNHVITQTEIEQISWGIGWLREKKNKEGSEKKWKE